MTDEQLEALLAFAGELADEAGRRLRRWFGKVTAGTKRDGSYVTEADLEVDRVIHEAVATRFPEHGLVSEEISLVYEGREFTWTVDPLDGTTNFASGLYHWGSSIALLHRGHPIVGLLDFPMLAQRFSATCGRGAWLNGRPLRVELPAAVHHNHLLALDSRATRYVALDLPAKPRTLGSAAFDLAAVASGVAVASLLVSPKVWDLAAGWLVVREAGATVDLLFDGDPLFPLEPGRDYGSRMFPLLAAAGPAIWRQFHSAICWRRSAGPFIGRLQAQGWRVDDPAAAGDVECPPVAQDDSLGE